MPHPDEETLSLLALGEPADPATMQHLAGCPDCRAQVTDLSSVVAAARALVEPYVNGRRVDDGRPGRAIDVTEGLPLRPSAPPAQVWLRIATATGVSVVARDDLVRLGEGTDYAALEPALGAALGSAPRSAVGPAPGPAVGSAVGSEPAPRPAPRAALRSSAVAPRAVRRRRSPDVLTFAVAASMLGGLFVGAGGTLGLQRWGSTGAGEPVPLVLGAARLSGSGDSAVAEGTAEWVRSADGTRLEVTVRRLAQTNGYYEVWLADPATRRMVALGMLSGDRASFEVPAGIDPAALPTVDISAEPLDGDPRHSDVTVLRGTLTE